MRSLVLAFSLALVACASPLGNGRAPSADDEHTQVALESPRVLDAAVVQSLAGGCSAPGAGGPRWSMAMAALLAAFATLAMRSGPRGR